MFHFILIDINIIIMYMVVRLADCVLGNEIHFIRNSCGQRHITEAV